MKDLAYLKLHCGDGKIDVWEGGRTGRQFVVWAGSYSWYLLGIGETMHEAEVIKSCLKF